MISPSMTNMVIVRMHGNGVVKLMNGLCKIIIVYISGMCKIITVYISGLCKCFFYFIILNCVNVFFYSSFWTA
jgi:hypothetical protein